MKNVIVFQTMLRIFSVVTWLLFSFTNGGISDDGTSFDELCSYEGKCLNCSNGGCENMCAFYDNNCCVNITTNTVQKKWQYSCIRKFPDMYDMHLDCRSSFNGVYGVYMVTKCSEFWKDSVIRAKCENSSEGDMMSRIPVFDVMNEVVTYKNLFCAFCNKLSLQDLRFWKFDLMCNTDADMTKNGDVLPSSDDACFIRLVYRQHRMCAIDVIENCGMNENVNSSLREKCENGLPQHVYVWQAERMFRIYKNEFCAECNFEAGELQCWAFQAFSCWPQNLPPYKTVRAKINFHLTNQSFTNSVGLYNSSCGEGVIYDPFERICMNITCLPSKNICVSGKCHLAELFSSEIIIQNDSSLYVIALDDIFEDGRYFVETSSIHVCLDDRQYMKFKLMQTTTLLTSETSMMTSDQSETVTSVITEFKSLTTDLTSSTGRTFFDKSILLAYFGIILLI